MEECENTDFSLVYRCCIIFDLQHSICTVQYVLLQTAFFLVNIHTGFQFQDIVNVVDRVFEEFSLSSFYKVREKLLIWLIFRQNEVMSLLISFNKSSIYTMQPVLWEFECYSRNIAPLFVSVSVNTVTWFPLQLWSTQISTSPLADNREKKNRNVST